MMYLMDSGTCAKSWRNPDLHMNKLGHHKDFSRGGGNSGFFQCCLYKHFSSGANSL